MALLPPDELERQVRAEMARTSLLPTRRWTVAVIAPDLIRVDTYEESLGDEWRGSVLLDAAEARRFATDLARGAADAEQRAGRKR